MVACVCGVVEWSVNDVGEVFEITRNRRVERCIWRLGLRCYVGRCLHSSQGVGTNYHSCSYLGTCGGVTQCSVIVTTSQWCRQYEGAIVKIHLWCRCCSTSSVWRQFGMTAHVPGVDNGPADSLSRNKVNLFFDLIPQARTEPSPVPGELVGRLSVRDPWTSDIWSA